MIFLESKLFKAGNYNLETVAATENLFGEGAEPCMSGWVASEASRISWGFLKLGC